MTIRRRADSAGAVLAIVGVINVPIIYFSVQWWNTLHQGATIRTSGQAHNGAADAGGDADHAGGMLALFDRRGAGAFALHHP